MSRWDYWNDLCQYDKEPNILNPFNLSKYRLGFQDEGGEVRLETYCAHKSPYSIKLNNYSINLMILNYI